MEGRREGGLYEFIDDRRAKGIDKVNRELQDEDNEKERRHDVFSISWVCKSRQGGYGDNSLPGATNNSTLTLTPSPIKAASFTFPLLFLPHALTSAPHPR